MLVLFVFFPCSDMVSKWKRFSTWLRAIPYIDEWFASLYLMWFAYFSCWIFFNLVSEKFGMVSGLINIKLPTTMLCLWMMNSMLALFCHVRNFHLQTMLVFCSSIAYFPMWFLFCGFCFCFVCRLALTRSIRNV